MRCIAARLKQNALTLFGEDSDADSWVTQLDEGGVPGPPVILSDQKDVFGTDVAVNKMLFLLRVEKRRRSVEETLGGIIKVTPFTDSLRYAGIKRGARRVSSYQKVHGLSQLLSHLQLPQDVY